MDTPSHPAPAPKRVCDGTELRGGGLWSPPHPAPAPKSATISRVCDGIIIIIARVCDGIIISIARVCDGIIISIVVVARHAPDHISRSYQPVSVGLAIGVAPLLAGSIPTVLRVEDTHGH